MRKYSFVFASGILFLASFTISAHAQCGPVGTQPCRTPSAAASAKPNRAKTSPPKNKPKTAVVQQSKAKSPKTTKDNESIFRSLELKPQAVKNSLATSKALFPLYGISIGKTTQLQMTTLGGQKKTYLDESTKEERTYYTVQGYDFWTRDGIASSISLFNFQPMPQKWGDLGFSWKLSFNEFTALLKKLGYQIDTSLPPPQILDTDKTFTGRISASRNDGVPLKIISTFLFSKDKPSADTPGAMFYLLVFIPQQN